MARIIVLDDEVVILNMVQECLSMDGHKVTVFSDAEPTLTEFDFDLVDLVITDLKMPTSGEVFIKELRDRNIQIPIIVMSGRISQETSEILGKLNVGAVLTKPFTLIELRRAMNICL